MEKVQYRKRNGWLGEEIDRGKECQSRKGHAKKAQQVNGYMVRYSRHA